jgi:hypothetical protein
MIPITARSKIAEKIIADVPIAILVTLERHC